ncbi:MAG TPA: type II toxin-antitoxin system VapC family toxin [Blastocatellia bacterium]|nr:type II toxin-antitoxin system VapC family toxin [Blastocatellia bacterium]HMX28387.1 type II toxin-antitoxin system VapC family toxin [Blastocatellia bacterium]HMY75106.1 type II toxin-antitoxin system VapC family toxin [Blastocatellia bacterium]HMZ17249.1 type II toxin-antitoxin system VapC family toxin [Blastocatellia bacterium]HNG28469.1 type II toxin-antitoxin system VapC family toxin [Blastocatellia bacterium]
MTFDDLQEGEQVFLDANVFVYHFLGQSADCRQLFSRCHQGALHGFTAGFIVAEVMHRLMTAEAVARGLVTSSQVVKKLRERPDIVRQLQAPNQCIAQIKAMKIEIVPLTVAMLETSANVRLQHGLLTNDSLLVAAMHELNLQKLATHDQDFARISGLLVYQPTDIAS